MLFSKIDLVIGAIGIRLMRKYKNFRNVPDVVFVKKNLAFGGATSYQGLEKKNINSVLDLRLEKPDEIITNNLIKYQKIGIPDGDIPSDNQVLQIEKTIKSNLSEGKTLLIHCSLGRGRATMITLLYLVYEGIDFENALAMVRKRRFVYLNKKQFNFIKKYAENNRND